MFNNSSALTLNPEVILLESFLGIPVVLIIANIFLILLFVGISKIFQYLSYRNSKSVKGGFIKSVFTHRDVK